MDKSETKQRKGFFWGYSIIALIAVVGGIFSIYYRINQVAPTLFALDTTPGPIQTTAQERLQQIAELKLKDTDSDGLSDYDETYVYSTSVDLADSDSDSVNDKAEVDAGTDPNCATGATCTQTTVATTNASAVSPADTNSSTSVSNLDTSDPVALRAQLLKLGIPQNVLDQVSDADLVDVYSSVAADYSTANTTNNSDPYANLLTNSGTADSIGVNPSAADIRTYLLQAGVPASQLDGLDDAALLAVYQQIVQEQTTVQTNSIK